MSPFGMHCTLRRTAGHHLGQSLTRWCSADKCSSIAHPYCEAFISPVIHFFFLHSRSSLNCLSWLQPLQILLS